MITMFAAAALASAVSSANCTALANVALENGRVASAELIPPGILQVPAVNGGPRVDSQPMPAYCRVRMVLTPSSDSSINVELWLPEKGWNGRFLAVGNGGWGGSIQGYGDMQQALRRGYATAGTDTGHSAADGPNGMFALGHPEKVVDFAYRAIHEMTEKSKAVIQQAYGEAAEYSYFKGCSTGGRQGVMAAQRYPEDFDGIIAGALANQHVHMHIADSYRTIFNNRNPEYAIQWQYNADVINDAIMKQCDVLHEGFLNDPRQCQMNFKPLTCNRQNGDTSYSENCLVPQQVITAEDYYVNGTRTKDGKLVFPPQVLGNNIPRLPFNFLAPDAFVFDTIRILGFENSAYNWRNFNLDRDVPIIDQKAGFIDATNPDLRAFEAHGGKLLMYHGWNDTTITPNSTIYYYESVVQEMGDSAKDMTRLFMVPGMGHCEGGDGPYQFELLTTMERWREKGKAPKEIPARNPESGLTRPLCAYPETAAYDGSGDLSKARNWDCKAL